MEMHSENKMVQAGPLIVNTDKENVKEILSKLVQLKNMIFLLKLYLLSSVYSRIQTIGLVQVKNVRQILD
jgi:hypothetical protein